MGMLLLLWPMDNLGYSSDAMDVSALILIPTINANAVEGSVMDWNLMIIHPS